MSRNTCVSILIISLFSLYSCQHTKTDSTALINISPDYSEYIESHTTGTISKLDPITIDFDESIDQSKQLAGLIEIKPSVQGNWIWDNYRAIFTTQNSFLPDQVYTITIDLSALFKQVPDHLAEARFNLATMKPDFEISTGGFNFMEDDGTKFMTTFTLKSADHIENEVAEKMFELKGAYGDLPRTWKHINSRIHQVTISEISREEDEYEIPYSISGTLIQSAKVINGALQVPAKGAFQVQHVRTDPESANFVEILFSDPLNKAQKLDGLIEVDGVDNYTYQISNNLLQVFFATRLSGEKKIKLHAGIQNHAGNAINSPKEYVLTFELIKPAVRMVARGSILPSSNNTTIPFETVNLKAIDVTVDQIYIENVPQYLQVNNLANEGSIHRVGKQIMARTIPLNITVPLEQNEWIQHHLDLRDILEVEPGSIYKVSLSFRKNIAIYPCIGLDTSYTSIDLIQEPWISDPLPNQNIWSSYYPEGYDWQLREDPCHVSYYTGDKKVTKNVMASDLGLIAKVTNDQRLYLMTTNLITALPESSVDLVLLDYQLQPILETRSDDQGMVAIAPPERPYMVIARKGYQQAYLRLDDGQALTVSQFNVAGDKIKQGLKVFIYGERDIWRPGDDIYLTCMIDDKDFPLPAEHPIQFKLISPQGTLLNEQTQALNDFGTHTFKAKTSNAAPTGTWLAQILIGNQSFSKKIKIETIQPNRLKAELSLPSDQISAQTKSLNGDLKVKWLTGVNGNQIDCIYNIDIWDREISFAGYEQYTFRDPGKQVYFEEMEAFNVTTDASGKALFNIKLPALEDAPGKMQLVLKGKLFEPSGNFSIDNQTITLSPYTSYIGLVFPENEDRSYDLNSNLNIQVVNLTETGSKVNQNNLTYSLHKMSWQWWWDQSGSHANYIGSQIRESVFEGKAKINNGKTSIQINPKQGGRYYLRICDTQSGHCSGAEFYMDWGSDDDQSAELGSAVLALTTSQSSYNIGENIKLTIPGYEQARALVSIENGSSVIQQEWIELAGDQTTYQVQASREMTPNVYFHVSLIQPHAQTFNDLPIRLYGIAPVSVKDESSVLEPIINMPDKLEPEKEFNINITEGQGRPMIYTIAIVDEGLLDITNYRTPDPWNHFNAKEALGVRTWDLYDQVIGSYGNRIERLLTIGGDGEESMTTNRKANRFEPVVKFLGPFHLTADGNQNHKITLPNYIGSVRTMLVAKNDTEYGNAEKSTPVTKPVMVLSTLPRVLGPGEKCRLPVSVFALEDNIKSVKIDITTEGTLLVDGATSKNITFTQPGDQVVNFDLTVKSLEGIGKVLVTATAGKYQAVHEVELDTRIANPKITEVAAKVLQANQTISMEIPMVGLTGTNHSVVELSTLPPLNLNKRLDYLIGYPHGCLEQTTSKVFPQLFLANLVELTPEQQRDIRNHVVAAIQKMKQFQMSNGGFSYWPGSGIDFWTSSYAGNFLLQAREQGFNVPEQMIQSFLTFQSKTARGWNRNNSYNNDLQQAYRLYTLAEGGQPELGLMNRLREDPKISWIAQWQLAATYAVIGQKEVADQIIRDLSLNNLTDYQDRMTFGSETRNQAIILEAYQAMDKKEDAFTLLKQLAEKLASDQWMSTQTTAFTLKAIGSTIGKRNEIPGINAVVKLNDMDELGVNTLKGYKQLVIPIEALQEPNLIIENKNDQVLFARVISSGKPAARQETADNKGLNCKIQLVNQNGEIINNSNYEQGVDLKLIVTIGNLTGQRIEEIAMTQIIPSGWEIINNRLVEGYQETQLFDYQDIRDDRVYTYFELEAGEKKTFTIHVNNTYAGKYYMPGTLIEAMYDHSKYARTTGQWITISD